MAKEEDIEFNEKIGDKTEKKIKVDVELVERIIEKFLEEMDFDKKIEKKFNELYSELDISYDQIKLNSKLRTKRNYKNQFDHKFFDSLHEYIEKELVLDAATYIKEKSLTNTEEDQNILVIVMNNIFEDIGMTMFDAKLSKVELISFHYLLKNIEVYSDEYTNILNLKNIRGHRISIEVFRYELMDVIANSEHLTMFVMTLKSLIEQWIIKYNRRTKIGQFYFDILMTTPELMVEKILRFMIFTSVKNKNPMVLRAIFSSYVTLIHLNISSNYSGKLTNVRVGHFSQLNNLFEENSSKQLSNFHNINQMITITRAKNHLTRNKRLYKDNFSILNDPEISTFLDINYQDFVSGYRGEINLLDYFYIYNKFLKNTKNGFSSINNTIKIKTSYLRTNPGNLKPYVKQMVLDKFNDRIIDVTGDADTAEEICQNMADNIITQLFPKGYLDSNLKLTIQSYDIYISDIQRLINGFEKIFQGELEVV